jgi:hypothetical protein
VAGFFVPYQSDLIHHCIEGVMDGVDPFFFM